MLTMVIYSFCNVDDLSWGTKDRDTTTTAQKKKNEFSRFKVQYVVIWICINWLLVIVFIYLSNSKDFSSLFIMSLAYLYTANIFVVMMGAVLNDIL